MDHGGKKKKGMKKKSAKKGMMKKKGMKKKGAYGRQKRRQRFCHWRFSSI